MSKTAAILCCTSASPSRSGPAAELAEAPPRSAASGFDGFGLIRTAAKVLSKMASASSDGGSAESRLQGVSKTVDRPFRR